MHIQALGASFGIHSHNNGEVVETVLTSGKIVLPDRDHRAVLEMSPGEKVIFITGQNTYHID